MAANLKTIRARIADLTAEIKAVEKSIPPAADLENQLRASLQEQADSVNTLIENCAFALSTGDMGRLFVDPRVLAQKAFGMALHSVGIGPIVQAAKDRAAELDTGRLRMPTSEKRKRLSELKAARYLAELDEQELIGTEAQRPDVSGAALLGIPLDVVEASDLLEGK